MPEKEMVCLPSLIKKQHLLLILKDWEEKTPTEMPAPNHRDMKVHFVCLDVFPCVGKWKKEKYRGTEKRHSEGTCTQKICIVDFLNNNHLCAELVCKGGSRSIG